MSIGGLKGDALANGLMKAETKAKRRVTLSLCGLGMLDDSEVETIPNAQRVPAALPAPATNGHADPVPADEDEITDLRGLCNWAMDQFPDEFVSDDSVKQALRAHGVKTWGKGTDVKALQSMLAHDAGQRRA